MDKKYFTNVSDLYDALIQSIPTDREIVVACIGSDRSTGDSAGPLVGMFLKERGIKNIYGCIKEPVHANNLREHLSYIESHHKDAFIIAVDACLAKKAENVGKIHIKQGPLTPGSCMGKDLPAVGDLSVLLIVNLGGFMESSVLQNTRLSVVMEMSKIVSEALALALCREAA